MKNNIYLFALFTMFFTTVSAQKETTSQIFWGNLTKLCGKSYEGQITMGGKLGDGFLGETLIMHVRKCDEKEIQIHFNVGDDLSRTWILKKNKEGFIQLKHDHRKKNGSNDKLTMYGGTNVNLGSDNLQIFPADEYTRNMIPYAASNVWWITIDSKSFSYNLIKINNSRVFTITFDLTKEVKTPEKSWGW